MKSRSLRVDFKFLFIFVKYYFKRYVCGINEAVFSVDYLWSE